LLRVLDAPATLRWGSDKCRLFAGDTIYSRTQPELSGDHYAIDMSTYIPGCEFSRGYVPADDVTEASTGGGGGGAPPPPGGSGACHADISVRECALLSTIAYAEGTDDRYNIIFGYETFSSYADHPRRIVCSGGYCSDAAGRYQFLSTTWDGVAARRGLRDFSPANQDRGALDLIRSRGVTWIDQIDTYDEFADAIYRLNLEWASLPGSPYGQPTHSLWSLWTVYRANESY
jgi:muramidase (phage lysozyme)